MRPSKPKPGTVLSNDDDDVILVVERGWSDETIRDHLARYTDDNEFAYKLTEFRWHTAEQIRCGDGDSSYDGWWSPEGMGRTRIDVAVVEP